jgi:hypothetical protein
MTNLLNEIRAAWASITKPTQASMPSGRQGRVRRYFLAGINQSSLWRGEYNENDKTMIMKEWVRSPFTKRMEWVGSFFGEWNEDKYFGVKEVSVFEAEAKFPGCTGARNESQKN